MVRHTDADARTEFETHDDAFAAVQSGDVEAGDTVEVEYVDVNGDTQVETGTVVDTDATPEGTVKGTEPRTWEVGSDIYGITYEVDGKNDHKVAGDTGQDEPPTLFTEVGGDHADGGNRREMGRVVGVTVFPGDATEDTDVDEGDAHDDARPDNDDDSDGGHVRFRYPAPYADDDAPDGFPEAGLLEGTDDVRVGYLSNRTDSMVEVVIDVNEVYSMAGDSTDTYFFAGEPRDRESTRYEVDFGTVTTKDSAGRLIKVGNVRYVDVPEDSVRLPDDDGDRVRTDGGTDVDPTPTECTWCGDERPRESMREAPDGLRCPECYHEPDHEHADPDFDFEDVRHVVTDRDGTHLVTVDDEDVALCGSLAGGLTTFGDPVEDVDDAVTLGAWVNVYDDMCPACRDVFNDAVFDRDD